jgi:hypothetical protein
MDTALFPILRCDSCGLDVLVAHDLDEHDRLVHACIRCGAVLGVEGEVTPRRLGAKALPGLGFDLDGAGGGGCGTGGSCTSCGTKAQA